MWDEVYSHASEFQTERIRAMVWQRYEGEMTVVKNSLPSLSYPHVQGQLKKEEAETQSSCSPLGPLPPSTWPTFLTLLS